MPVTQASSRPFDGSNVDLLAQADSNTEPSASGTHLDRPTLPSRGLIVCWLTILTAVSNSAPVKDAFESVSSSMTASLSLPRSSEPTVTATAAPVVIGHLNLIGACCPVR